MLQLSWLFPVTTISLSLPCQRPSGILGWVRRLNLIFWDRVSCWSLCGQGGSWGLILQPLLPKCWDYSDVSPHPILWCRFEPRVSGMPGKHCTEWVTFLLPTPQSAFCLAFCSCLGCYRFPFHPPWILLRGEMLELKEYSNPASVQPQSQLEGDALSTQSANWPSLGKVSWISLPKPPPRNMLGIFRSLWAPELSRTHSEPLPIQPQMSLAQARPGQPLLSSALTHFLTVQAKPAAWEKTFNPERPGGQNLASSRQYNMTWEPIYLTPGPEKALPTCYSQLCSG